MHRLDGLINDIEPRIISICDNAPKQEEPSLQTSLSSYGWILLDSWVAWRTLRFLLKEAYIDECVSEKWFQTPSSYTASQLRAVWGFSDSTTDYLYSTTGKRFNALINDTIQKNVMQVRILQEPEMLRGLILDLLQIYFKHYQRYLLFMKQIAL